MTFSYLRLSALLYLILLTLNPAHCHHDKASSAAYATKTLVKRPDGTKFKTMLSVGGGGLRALLSTMVLIELEQSIKRYIVAHPDELPHDADITSVDDFEVNLVDYFDCMTGITAGTWASMYLATRGAQGAFRAVLDDPANVEKYGVIPTGSAAGLRVFYREYAGLIYPPVGNNTGEPLDLTNPDSPGVLTPLYSLDGLEAAMEALYGQTKLSDMETSLIFPAFDLMTGYVILFMHSEFRDVPVTATGRLIPRVGPKTVFTPDLVWEEGKDYYLAELSVGAESVPAFQPAMPLSEVNNDTMEFLLTDGAIPVEAAEIPGSYFVATENGVAGWRDIAIVSIGNGHASDFDLPPFANAGIAGWLDGFQLLMIYHNSGIQSQMSLMDYIFYSNPNTKPYQYLRIQASAPIDTDVGVALSVFDQAIFLDVYEEVGLANAEAHRDAIDIFVRDFIFAKH